MFKLSSKGSQEENLSPEHKGSGEAQTKKTLAEIKTEEENARKDREKRFYDDPYSFIELKEIIACAIVVDGGQIATMVNPANRTQYEIVQSRLNFRINEKIMRMEVEAARKANPGRIIHPPAGGTQGAFGGRFRKR